MLAFDQDGPAGTGWQRVRWGLWRHEPSGAVWRSWRAFGSRAGHYPEADRARQMARRARAAETQFARSLRQVASQITQMIRGVFDPDNPADPGWDQIEEMLARYRGLLKPWAESVAARTLADVSRRDASGWHSLGLQIGRALSQEIRTAPTQDAIQRLHQYQVEQILKLPEDASERLRQSRVFSAEIVRQMKGPAEEAMVAGRRWEDLVKRVRDEGLHVQSSAATVARTEVSRAATTLQAVRSKHMGVELFQWLTSNDLEVRPLHRQIANTNVGYGKGIYRLDSPPILDDGRPGLPGTIYNCFPGDTLVDPLGGYRRVFRAFYRGQLIVLRIADGAGPLSTTLRVTPNHPILTPQGWVAAGRLQKGDYIIQAAPQCREAVEQNIDHRLLTFSEIFEAGASDVEPLAEFDFYGDAVEDEVEIIRPQRNLAFDRETALLQGLGENMIPASHRGIGPGRVVRGGSEIGEAFGARGGDPGVMLFTGLGGGDGLIDFALATHRRAIADQHVVQCLTTDPIFESQSVFAGTGKVFFDDLGFGQFQSPGRGAALRCNPDLYFGGTQFFADHVGVKSDDFGDPGKGHTFFVETTRVEEVAFSEYFGHVYTLETAQGYYAVTPARTIVKNCRCYLLPILPVLPS